MKHLRECKNWLTGRRKAHCQRFVNADRPPQTQYCDECKAQRARDWWTENRRHYSTPGRARQMREQWAEKHAGQTYPEYLAKYRASRIERTRELNRLHQKASRAKRAKLCLDVSNTNDVSTTKKN